MSLVSKWPEVKLAIKRASGNATRKAALDLYARVKRRTPIDTGRARAGWSLTEGGPSDAEGAIGNLSGHQPIYLSNPVEYAIFLEGGSSQQAPNGMLAISVAEMQVEGEKHLRRAMDEEGLK